MDVISGLVIMAVIGSCVMCTSATGSRIPEYCQTETFNASCPHGKVIQMTEARYGRMALGRCVRTDFGFLGCLSDVLAPLDKRCSGRQRCEVRIPDSALDNSQPCLGDLTRYLEADYSCISVVSAERTHCLRSAAIRVPSSGGFLSSYVTSQSGCGNSLRPWSIKVLPNQRINITLIDHGFMQDDVTSSGTLTNPIVCRTYGIIRDPEQQKSITICGGNKRMSHVYTSKGNKLQISFGNTQETFGNEFLLKYDVVGCSEPHYSNMVIEERGVESIVLKCPLTLETWRITCVDNSWSGNVGTCAGGSRVGSQTSSQWNNIIKAMPNGVAVLLIVIIAFIIGACILLLGLIFIRRKRSTVRRQQMAQAGHHIYSGGKPPDYTSYDPRQQHTLNHNQKYHPDAHRQLPQHPGQRPAASEVNQYAYTYRKQHGSSGNDGSHSNHRADQSRDTDEKHVEHVYESPVFSRRDLPALEGPQYFELNPEEMSRTGHVTG